MIEVYTFFIQNINVSCCDCIIIVEKRTKFDAYIASKKDSVIKTWS